MTYRLYETVERAKREILGDVRAGNVPAAVQGFAELHNYVDANGYGGAFEDEAPNCNAILENGISVEVVESDPRWGQCGFWNAVQDELDKWIKAGGIREGSKS